MCSSMADGSPNIKQQKLAPYTTAPNKKNPSKFYSHFFFKALIVAISLVTFPLFTSESPDLNTPSSYTRGWELLHLIFVGIAVSYGLFSRRNEVGDDDSERESNSKLDSAHSYMSRLLQFPSIFGDEIENLSGSDDDNTNKLQTWSSRYHRNQPLLVVAKKNSVSLEKSGIDEKPLLLPVRSLKTRISDGNDVELADGVNSRVYSRSISMPIAKESSNHSKRMDRIDGGFVSGASRVYTRPSSTPSAKGFSNDSRSMSQNGNLSSRYAGPTEFRHVNEDSGASGSLGRSSISPSSRGFSSNSSKVSSAKYGDLDDEDMDEQEDNVEENVVLSSPIPWQSRSRRIGLKGKSNGSPLFLHVQSMQELGSTQSFKSRSPRSSQSYSSSSSPTKLTPTHVSSSPKVSPPTTLPSESQSKSVEEARRRKFVYSSHLPPAPPPPPPPPPPAYRSRYAKLKPSTTIDCEDISTHHYDSMAQVNEIVEEKGIQGVENEATTGRKVREGINGMQEPPLKGSYLEFSKQNRDLLEEGLVETDYESESEDNDNYGESEEKMTSEKMEEVASSDEGPDVDKKADEFIAKFREQIRLQRIESIKRSTKQMKRSSEM